MSATSHREEAIRWAVRLAICLGIAGAVACTPDLTGDPGDPGTADAGDVGDDPDGDVREEDVRESDTGGANAGEIDADLDADLDATDTADASSPEPSWDRFQAFFNEPEGGENDPLLEDVLIDLVGMAEPGSAIRGAFYTWTRTGVAQAFVDAYEAGVDVRLVVGNNNFDSETGVPNGAMEILLDGLGDRLTVCSEGQSSGGCIGDGIQHNKFALFSELGDGSSQVVFQSSANPTSPQRRSFNNAVVIRGDGGLYDAYLGYWEDLREQEEDLDYYRSFVGDHGTKAYFFPRASGDTIVNVLNNITCDDDSEIHVGMARFTNPRVAIAEALAQRAAEGCEVSVLVRESFTSTSVIDALTAPGVFLGVFPDGATHAVHSKYLLVRAPYGSNERRQHLVWTGSHNYTGPALRRHDETLLKIEDEELYSAFLSNWEMMRDRLD